MTSYPPPPEPTPTEAAATTAELRAGLLEPLFEYEASVTPAPYTRERALYERLRELVEAVVEAEGHATWCHGHCCRECSFEERDCSVWTSAERLVAALLKTPALSRALGEAERLQRATELAERAASWVRASEKYPDSETYSVGYLHTHILADLAELAPSMQQPEEG